MAIHGVRLSKSSNVRYVVNALILICCRVGGGDNVAHLFGDEVSSISPSHKIQALPERTAKILSGISRRGLTFHVAPHGENHGIFIATHPKILNKHA